MFFKTKHEGWFLKMKNFQFCGMVVLLLLVSTVCYSQENNASSILLDGTYNFNPRPQATKAGQPVAAYLYKVTVINGYATFYITSVPNGTGNLNDIPGRWGTGDKKGTVVLQNLDNRELLYNDTDGESLVDRTGQYAAFDSVVGYRFSLRSEDVRPPIVFSEIVLRKPDLAYSPVETFIYAQAEFNPVAQKYTAKALKDVIADTKKGNVDGMYVSEVIFVSQRGTQLVFKTPDGSTTQEFQIKSTPTGLTSGQKVRIYYMALYQKRANNRDINSITEVWAVFAIDRM